MPQHKPRWHYRFDNYSRAFLLLREAVDSMNTRELSQLEKEGVIQRFGFTWELAWKLLKDCLDDGGIALDSITPRSVIRAAFAATMIADGEKWMQALDARNRMSHIYDIDVFNTIIKGIRCDYINLFAALYASLQNKHHA